MDNKMIQEQRMKGYFIQATKEILKSEGIASVNVRNIASQAGYSYATLYNYFKDIKDLIFICVKDFHEEIDLFIKEKVDGKKAGKERISVVSMTYILYFLEYPGIFELFYLERLSDISSNLEASRIIVNFLNLQLEEDWKVAETNETTRELKKNELNYIVAGMLLFFLNRKEPESYEKFILNCKNQIDHFLN